MNGVEREVGDDTKTAALTAATFGPPLCPVKGCQDQNTQQIHKDHNKKGGRVCLSDCLEKCVGGSWTELVKL